MLDLSDLATVKRLLSKNDFKFSKSLGQNFLVNASVCPRMAQAAFESGGGEGVIEIGAGIGVLSRELAKLFKKVVSFEVDKALLPVLSETLADFENIEIINSDVMKADLCSLIAERFEDMDVCVCANLPYYITSPIIMHLLESRLPLKSLTVMVQKEAADRLCAEVGSRSAGAVTVAVNYYASAKKLFGVSRHSFVPSPKVDSSVIQLAIRDEPPVFVDDEKKFFRLVRAAFCQRRKTAANSISAGLSLQKDKVEEALEKVGFDLNIRAEKFSLDDFSAVYKNLEY